MPETRRQKVVLETSRHRIKGEVTLPLEGLQTRVTDLLNAEGVDFIPLIDAELTPISGGEAEQRPFIAVALEHVQIAYEE
jgi:hypothetical protein